MMIWFSIAASSPLTVGWDCQLLPWPSLPSPQTQTYRNILVWYIFIKKILCKIVYLLLSLIHNNMFWKGSVCQFSAVAQCPTPCNPMNCSMLGFPVHHQLPEFTLTDVHLVSDAIQTSHPPSSPSPPDFRLSHIRAFSNESVLRIRWPKYQSFSFNISPSNEYSGLISFRMDWLALLAVQGTLKSLLELYSSKASILQCSAFFIVQLSHPYMTTGKTIALTRWNIVSKVMSLLFNMLSRSAITFLPRSKHLLMPWLQSPSAVILETKK